MRAELEKIERETIPELKERIASLGLVKGAGSGHREVMDRTNVLKGVAEQHDDRLNSADERLLALEETLVASAGRLEALEEVYGRWAAKEERTDLVSMGDLEALAQRIQALEDPVTAALAGIQDGEVVETPSSSEMAMDAARSTQPTIADEVADAERKEAAEAETAGADEREAERSIAAGEVL